MNQPYFRNICSCNIVLLNLNLTIGNLEKTRSYKPQVTGKHISYLFILNVYYILYTSVVMIIKHN